MALNWLMLDSKGAMEPLQGEKIFMTVPSVQLSLRPRGSAQRATTGSTPVSAQLQATGRVHLTNKRLCFISDTALSLPHPHQPPEYQLRTLSCPLSHFQEGRFVQPWFAANQYSATIMPVENGGFEEAQLAKLSFNEGRGFEFSQVVEEVSRRFLEETGGQLAAEEPESLPVYDPTPQASTSSSHTAAFQAGQVDIPRAQSPSPHQTQGEETSSTRPRTPDREDMEVAGVARDAEAREWRQRQNSIQEGPEGPPAYRP